MEMITNETVSDQINAVQSQQARLVTQPNLRRNNKAKEEIIDCISFQGQAFVKLTSNKL